MYRNKNKLIKNSTSNSLPIIENLINNYSFFIFLLLSLIISFVIYRDFFVGKNLFFFKDIGSDSINITFPNFLQGYNMNKSGEGMFKYWSFFSGLGQTYANPLTIKPYPYISRLLTDLFGINFWFYRIYYYYFFFIIVAGGVALAYFRTLNVSKYVSIIGALLVEFSGYMIIGSQWSHAYEILYFVFLLFAFEQFLVKKRWYFFPLAVYCLSDNVYSLITNGFFLFLYSLVRYFDFNNESFKKYLNFLLKLIGLSILGVLMNAPRVVFYFLRMYHSPRGSGDVQQMSNLVSNPELINSSLRIITTILRFFGNDLLGTGSDFKGWYNYLEAPIFYIGIISLVSFSFVFSFLSSKKRILYGVFVFFWIFAAFFSPLRHILNLYVGNYFKVTLDIFVPFSILFLSIFAIDNIIKKQKLNPLLLVIVIGVLLIFVHYPYFKYNNSIVDFNMKLVVSFFIIFYGVILYFLANSKDKNLWKFIFLLVISSELVYFSWFPVNNRKIYTAKELKSDLAGYNDGTFEALKFIHAQDDELFFRIEKDYSSGNSDNSSLNDAKAQGYFGTPTYGSFNQLNYIKFLEEMEVIQKGNEGQTRWCTGVRGIPLLMTFVGVKYFLSHDIQNPLKFNDYDSIAFVKNIVIFKNKQSLPLGFTYNKYIKFSDFKNLSKFKKQEVLLNAVILNDNSDNYNLTEFDTTKLISVNSFNLIAYSQMVDSLNDEVFKITSFKHKKIEGKISLKTSKMLFFSIPYDAGWRIYVNGNKQKLQKVNIGFSGIYLSKGNYNLTLIYKPPYFYITIVIAIIAFLFYFFLLLKLKKKKV